MRSLSPCFDAIGLDIAKDVFQVHGIDAAEKVVVRKRLRRSQVI
jgi:transposase